MSSGGKNHQQSNKSNLPTRRRRETTTSNRDPTTFSHHQRERRVLPSDDSPYNKTTSRRNKPQKPTGRRTYKENNLQSGGGNSLLDHSLSSMESGATVMTYASNQSLVYEDAASKCQYDNRDQGLQPAFEQYDPRDLLRVQRRQTKIDELHASDSQLPTAEHFPAATAFTNPLYASAPYGLDCSIEERPESKEGKRSTSSEAYDPANESLVFLCKLSDQLQQLEQRVKHMSSRQLMGLSERIGVPVAYSNTRGLELVDIREGTDIDRLTSHLQCVLREESY